jgi:hypothetical protein
MRSISPHEKATVKISLVIPYAPEEMRDSALPVSPAYWHIVSARNLGVESNQ